MTTTIRSASTRHVFLAALFGAILGFAASQVTRVQLADAQSGPRDSGQFRECVRYSGFAHHGDAEDLPGMARPIPAGWSVVGPSGATVLLCR